jgi:hypothetical protein
MYMKAHKYASSIPAGRMAAQRVCLLLLPILAVIPFLLPVGSLRADGSDSGVQGSTNSGSTLKAPKNSGGFVINLPNSGKQATRLSYSTGLIGESLNKAITRHVAGQLNFVSMAWGTEVTNARQDRSGILATYFADGSTAIGLLLPTKEFRMGGLASVEVSSMVGSGSKKGPQVPTIVYFTITSDNLMLDVPVVLAAAKAGNISDFTLRFYNLQAQERVRLDLHVDVDGQSVQLIF